MNINSIFFLSKRKKTGNDVIEGSHEFWYMKEDEYFERDFIREILCKGYPEIVFFWRSTQRIYTLMLPKLTMNLKKDRQNKQESAKRVSNIWDLYLHCPVALSWVWD